jgi:hypothetical protein
VTGTPARLWNGLEATYRSDLERIRAKRDLSADVMWLGDFPVTELVKRDILPAEPTDKISRLEQVLAFFEVASVDAYQDVYSELTCAFRTSKTYEAKAGALTAWLRLGELAAQDIYCEPYDRKRLEAALPSLRELTLQDTEADSFSRDTLVPRADAKELPSLKTLDDVQHFADRIGIAPGIVVGRLQRDNLWPYSQGNQLKRPLSFPAIADE